MDTDSMSFCYEEHFPSYESSDFFTGDDESQSAEELFNNSSNIPYWDWEVEQEINGDIALIPMSSNIGMNYLSNSPPAREDFQKIMSEWQHFMNSEVSEIDGCSTEMPLTDMCDDVSEIQHTPKQSTKTSRFPGKKIDLNAQCYIINNEVDNTVIKEETDSQVESASETIHLIDKLKSEDHDSENDFVDVDTITDITNPILQAGDLNSLLEQFEANESYQPGLSVVKVEELVQIKQEFQQIKCETESIDESKPDNFSTQCLIVNNASKGNKLAVHNTVIKKEVVDNIDSGFKSHHVINELKSEDHDSENDFVDVDTVTNVNTPILQAGDLNSLLEQFEATESNQPKSPVVKDDFETNNIDTDNETIDKSKQILDALPQELIMKIKASSKRRVIPVIDAMPNKKRCKKIQSELLTPNAPIATVDGLDKTIKNESVQLDHDYCSQSTPYPKHPQKDSGFESAEEDEQRSILKKQPTFKGADGKLMVSLLKINTIRNSIVTENNKIKRKLNLEEYKKRREGIIRVNTDSHGNSPTSSGANSPVVVEDENIRLLKHQKKLMQMAEEVLKTPPKSASVNVQNCVAESTQASVVPAPSVGPPILPSNIEVKTLVSMGVNTVVSSTQVEPSELEDIKPILQSASTKINDNSLITSVIKNIQKIKTNVVPQSNNKDQEHGEDKTIVYLDKCRPPIETRNVEIQTEPEVEDTTKHKRKRSCSVSSNSSGEQRKSYKRRSGSNDSHYSYSSRSSSASSRSRSRSRSPRRTYTKKRLIGNDRERIKEVEERRIVYVGGISSSTSKDNLRRRFQVFGPITNVSVHFRGYGDNYGFVTYVYKADAYKAVEHGNDDPILPKYDLSFGGRRIFCRTNYSDLDNMQDDKMYPSQVDDSFDNLLREAKAKLRKRKSCT